MLGHLALWVWMHSALEVMKQTGGQPEPEPDLFQPGWHKAALALVVPYLYTSLVTFVVIAALKGVVVDTSRVIIWVAHYIMRTGFYLIGAVLVCALALVAYEFALLSEEPSQTILLHYLLALR